MKWIYLIIFPCLVVQIAAIKFKQQASPVCPATANPGTVSCENVKVTSLNQYRASSTDPFTSILTTNQGVRIADNQNTLRAGARGSALMEDFIMREKITHFDHERIPERVVHARGSGAHGYFQVYRSMANITKAGFLQDPTAVTPVFVRFSTVGGSKGSADTARDVRGFATKFYTNEGNFDLVGNNMPVFFIQDAIKFPDFVHAVKPEPHNHIPQASSAHNNLYDFVTQQTETTHMMMWLMSDRAIPRSFAMMEGFGVHTFRLINADGVSRFVKWHWMPVLGVYSLVWDEAQKLAGKNSDFNRQQLWDDIEAGQYPEYELGIQVVEEADQYNFDFDILDATKLIPEELVPVQRIGRMVLNRNPDNFHAETEQVAFCTAHLVPGIDFSDDPLMQGRSFSYIDTQLTRLGGSNFHEIPINRPVAPFRNNNQRDGFHRETINVGTTNYDINSLNNGLPKEAGPQTGFTSYPEQLSGTKIRQRSSTFSEHYAQATLFWKSMSGPEQDHIVSAFSFELSKVASVLRDRMLQQLQNVDGDLAARIAVNLRVSLQPQPSNGYPRAVTPSPSLSQTNDVRNSVKTRRIAILAADGVDGTAVADLTAALVAAGASAKIIAPHMGTVQVSSGAALTADGTLVANPSILFDAIFIPGGKDSIAALEASGDAIHYAYEAYIHYKPIGAAADARDFLSSIDLISQNATEALPAGMLISSSNTLSDQFKQQFIDAVAYHRFFNRQRVSAIPA